MNYTFTDQEDDDEAGLYNYKARLYDPLLGRFISADSIVPEPGNLQAYNRYSYCLNNPVVYTDPSGQFSLGDVFNAFITGVVAAVVFWATGGTGTPGITTFIAGITAGAAGGATASALSGGNLQGILQGAVMGAVIGGATGGLLGGIGAEYGASAMQWAGYGVMAAGGGAAYASGGLDGLAYYAAGMLGAMAGAYGAGYVAKNWNRWFATELSPQKAGQQVADGLVVSQSETTITEALNERWSRYGMQVENIRRYTILDWPGPETPFAIYHFKQEFLAQVKILQQTDLLYANYWAKLHKDYSFLRAAIDYYRFDVDEAIEHYRSSFGEKLSEATLQILGWLVCCTKRGMEYL